MIRKGATRWVICLGRYAFKLPSLHSYTDFLGGLRSNVFEYKTYEYAKEGAFPIDKFCPIVFSLPLGLLNVMRRAAVMKNEEFKHFKVEKFCNMGDYVIPVEHKSDSFGWLNGRIVAIDYGS